MPPYTPLSEISAAALHRLDREHEGRESVDAYGLGEALLRRRSGSIPTADCRRRHRVAVRLHAHRIEHGVGAAPVGAVRSASTVIGEVEGLDAVTLGHGAPFRNGIYAMTRWPKVASDAGCELTHRPQAEDGQGAAVGNVRVLHALPRSREDVAEEEVTLIRQVAVPPLWR